ncbi:hypothetical protein GR247_37980 [Rhizobium leguminosarum]|uniref:Uncharacterized protein n=1 Tax=Rhizobium leguminosarum TaxID=384 RepID=A0A6P0DR49_RHILE|nr:hypothetical protein [Rhizobium leguminosarum]NEJ25824.1 hypothetical protein [Rhizobium leguminosarum]NEK54837.1 hypothetical protein [Rhizobium leguminosarum]
MKKNEELDLHTHTSMRNKNASSSLGEALDDDAIANIAHHIVTDDPVETSKNFTKLKLISKSVKQGFERSAYGKFHQRINRLGIASKALYDNAVLKEGFVEHPPALQRDYALAAERIEAVGGTFRLQTPQRKSAVVDHILSMPEGYDQALALESISPHVGDLSAEDRHRVVNKMLEHFATPYQEGGLPVGENFCGAHALSKAFPHMENSLKAKMLEVVLEHPHLATLHWTQTELVEHWHQNREAEKSAWRSNQKPTVEERLTDLERSIDTDIDVTNRSDFTRMHSARPLQQAISDTFDLAREELKSRPREGRGR